MFGGIAGAKRLRVRRDGQLIGRRSQLEDLRRESRQPATIERRAVVGNVDREFSSENRG